MGTVVQLSERSTSPATRPPAPIEPNVQALRRAVADQIAEAATTHEILRQSIDMLRRSLKTLGDALEMIGDAAVREELLRQIRSADTKALLESEKLSGTQQAMRAMSLL